MQIELAMFLAIVAATCNLARGQEQPAVASDPVTYQDVIKLLRSGSSEQEILGTLAKSTIDVNFVLGESQVQDLKKMRVSDDFLEALGSSKPSRGFPGVTLRTLR